MSRPVRTTTSVAIIAFCLIVMIIDLAICNNHFMRDLEYPDGYGRQQVKFGTSNWQYETVLNYILLPTRASPDENE